MSETTDRFVIEIGGGTVAHVIDMEASESEAENLRSIRPIAPGEKMCSRGYRDCRFQRVPFAASDTGRRHYREIADHLDAMQELVPKRTIRGVRQIPRGRTPEPVGIS